MIEKILQDYNEIEIFVKKVDYDVDELEIIKEMYLTYAQIVLNQADINFSDLDRWSALAMADKFNGSYTKRIKIYFKYLQEYHHIVDYLKQLGEDVWDPDLIEETTNKLKKELTQAKNQFNYEIRTFIKFLKDEPFEHDLDINNYICLYHASLYSELFILVHKTVGYPVLLGARDLTSLKKSKDVFSQTIEILKHPIHAKWAINNSLGLDYKSKGRPADDEEVINGETPYHEWDGYITAFFDMKKDLITFYNFIDEHHRGPFNKKLRKNLQKFKGCI